MAARTRARPSQRVYVCVYVLSACACVCGGFAVLVSLLYDFSFELRPPPFEPHGLGIFVRIASEILCCLLLLPREHGKRLSRGVG